MNPTALMTDLYQLTMAAGYFSQRMHEQRVTFELFVRRLPEHRKYLLVAGLETALSYLRELRFTEAQIAYLREVPPLKSAMSWEFVEYLRNFRFRGDVWAMPEGTVAFANEPLVRVTGTLLETQLVETFLLSAINTETVVASKAARIIHAAQGRPVLEFGTRRTSAEEAVASARAAYLAGFAATSNVEAGYRYDIPIAGTAAHSWIMAHADEQVAFAHYVAAFPKHAYLLVDTYDTLEGTKRAILAAGPKLKGVRLDSGDPLSLSRQVRALLDAAGMQETHVIVSGDLDEYKISELVAANAPINTFGVGTELVRSRDNPALGGVYKLVYDHTADRPVAKLSEGKVTLPGLHQVYRLIRNDLARQDVIGTLGEFHVDSEPLLVEWMKGGQLTRPLPSLAQLRARARAQLAALPPHVVSLDESTPPYDVQLSHGLSSLVDTVKRTQRH